MKKVNPFPALTAPCPLIFLSKLSNICEVALVANLGKTKQLCFTKFYIRQNIVSEGIFYFVFSSCC